ncbi:hypothetical protein KC678_04630, partial [Candidatus Dojkabacteria bacterium]|nr:hypothetical protein [Candidatus Dojkabacteria bacterium]
KGLENNKFIFRPLDLRNASSYRYIEYDLNVFLDKKVLIHFSNTLNHIRNYKAVFTGFTPMEWAETLLTRKKANTLITTCDRDPLTALKQTNSIYEKEVTIFNIQVSKQPN